MSHARLSPSSAFRWRVCPGSVREEAKYPDTDNEYSLRGTAAHFVGEDCLKNGRTPGYWRDQKVLVDKVDGTQETITITTEDTEAVWTYVDYVLRRMEAIPGVHAEFETKLNPGIWLGRDDCEGTGDCALFSNVELEAVDYKHGAGVAVDAIENEQLLEYMIGMCARMDWTQISHDIPVTGTIVQPRAPHPDGPIRTWTLTAREIFARVPEVKIWCEATDDPNAPLVPGDKQCRFCKAKAECPALRASATEVFKPQTGFVDPVSHALEEDSAWDTAEQNLGRPVDQMTMAEKVAIKEKMPLIRAWMKAVDESLLEDALSGTEVPGFKVVEGKSNRKWEMEEEALIKKLAALKNRQPDEKGKFGSLGQKIVTKTTVLSPAQAEKIIRPLVTEKTWRNLQKFIVKPPGAPTLVPVTDPREPVKGPEQVFEKQESTPEWLQ